MAHISVFVPGVPNSDTFVDPVTGLPWTEETAAAQVTWSRMHGVEAEWYDADA